MARTATATSLPSTVSQALNTAERARRKGDACSAAREFAAVLLQFPDNRRARQGLRTTRAPALPDLAGRARKAEASGALVQAETLWAESALLAPDDDNIARTLARCRLELGQFDGALNALEPILKLMPDCAATLDLLGRILRETGQIDRAEASHRAALRGTPSDAAPLNNLGIIARARGDVSAAAIWFRKAIDAAPTNGDVHYNLARCGDAGGEASEHIDELGKLPPNDPAVQFAFFERFHALKQYATGFAHLTRANQLRRATARFDPAREAALFSWLARMAPPPPRDIAPLKGPRPVFIVGLPRSGTTLAERILGQSEGAQMAGELPVVSGAVAPLLRRLQEQGRNTPNTDDIAALRHAIDAGLTARSDGRPVLIDKMPLNFRWVGLLHVALPEARFVDVTRDPVPLAFSLLRHSFAGRGNGFCYDPAHVVAYMALHKALTGEWARRLDDRIHHLHYGDLVTNPEQQGKALCAACDLDWGRRNLHPEANSAPVLTASNMQVRQPIQPGADDGWHPYRAELAPIIAALNSAGIA